MFKIHRQPQSEGALKKSIQKLFDHKKDVGTRLKHLKNVIDNSTPSEVHSLFEKHYSHIYYIFYENFLLAESNLRLRGSHRAQREELDSILAVFEQILINLPDLIHRRWQYHSIDTIIKKLLHTQNSIKVRKEGLHFFLLWLRALRENAQPQTILVYACLIPGFPPPLFSDGKPYSLEWLVNMPINEEYGVHPSEITSLVPPSSGEKQPNDLTKYFLDALLECMVLKSQTLNWKDKEKSSVESFSFLWDLFKQHYLPHAFEDFSYETNIYKCDLALPEPRPSIAYVVNASDTGSLEPQIEVSSAYSMLATRVSIIKWAVAFTGSCEKKETFVPRPNSAIHAMQRQVLKQLLEFTGSQNGNDSESAESRSNTLTNAVLPSGGQLPDSEMSASNTSTLTEKEPSISSLSSLDDKLQSSTAADENIVRRVFYSTRQNINIIHELFRQAFMLPLTEVTTMRRVVKVYQQWIQQEDEIPVFMKMPISLDESYEKIQSDDNSLRNTSYMRGQLRPVLDDEYYAHVRAGPESTYQLFITNSAHVFLVQPPQNAPKLVQLQVDVCKRVLNLYRYMVMNITLSDSTWSQLLRILLHITRIMLQDVDYPEDELVRHQSVSGRLAGPVFQTLIVSWIKANLYVHVSVQLWDELVDALSSLCHWEDLITEWSKNMETMTRVLSRNVYQIDLSDLPLDRLTEQKHKKRKAGVRNQRSTTNFPFSTQRSFSRGWSQDSISANDNQAASLDQSSRSTSVALSQSSEDKSRGDVKPRLSKFLSIDSVRPRSQTVPSASALIEKEGSSKESIDDQTVGLHVPPESNSSTLKRNLSTSDVTDLNGAATTTVRHHSEPEDVTTSPNRDSPSSNSGLRVAWQHPTHQVHSYQCGSGGDASECTSLSVHSIEDGDEFDALVSQRLNSDSQDRDKRSDEVWPNEATSLHSQDSASIDTDWNRLVEPGVEHKQENQSHDTGTPHSVDVNVSSCDGKHAPGDGKNLPLFEAFTDDSPPPYEHQNSIETSYSPPSTLPPLLPLLQSPPAIPARKALPPPVPVNLCDIHFLTPTSDTGDSNFTTGDSEKVSSLDLDSPSSLLLFSDPPSVVHQDTSSSDPLNPDLFNFEAPHNNTASQNPDHSVIKSSSSSVASPPYQPYEIDSSKRDSSSIQLLGESSANVLTDCDSSKDGMNTTGNTSLIAPSSYSAETTSTEDTKSLNPSEIEAMTRKIPSASDDKDDVLSTSNDDILLQPMNSSRTESRTRSKCDNEAGDLSGKDSELQGSIMSGGTRNGWYPDVAAALWRRLLGVLGDINEIEDPYIHGLVFQYLLELWQILHKMRQNIGIVNDNLSPPDNQELIPPLQMMSPWAFKAVLDLPDNYKDGRLRAFQLLCNSTIQRVHDIPLELEHLAQFYLVLHLNLHSTDQDIVNKIIESCSHYFPYCLPSSNLLLLDFIYACHVVAASSDLKAPRVHAQTILGSTLCFPNVYKDLPVLDPALSDPTINNCNNVKDYIVEALLTSSKKEPASAARCVALSSTGLWLYEELTSTQQRHPRVKEAINVLLVSLKFSNRTVAKVACSHLHLLTQCSDELLNSMPDMPPRIIEVMSLTISALLNTAEAKNSEPGRQLIVSLLLCILDWCMTVPVDLLTDTYGVQSEKRLIRTVFKALQTAAYGKPGHSAKHSYSLADLASTDFDPNLPLDTVLEGTGSFSRSKPSIPRSNTVPLGTDNAVSLAAHTVLNHLVNHLGHFPLARGTSVLSSLVSEHHDIDDAPDDLSPTLFDSPALQFLIYNDTCLLSVVEIPSEESRNNNLTSSNRCVRFIVRGASGKYSWDATVLHGPSNLTQLTTPVTCQTRSSSDDEIGHAAKRACQAYADYAEEEKLMKRLIEKTRLPHHEQPVNDKSADRLEQLLQHLGQSSPECQLIRGSPLNIPSAPPSCLSVDLQSKATECFLNHNQSLGNNYNENAHILTWKSSPIQPYKTTTPRMPFHHARRLLAELNFLSRDNRNRVNLLKKNERLLRELKNLDSRNCRETHKVAVFYIAKGQEDKVSILSNTGGSKGFEEFVAGLGWEVDLSNHCGFRGKLQSDGSNGKTTPYYATSTLEVIYHVATRFPSDETSRNVKIRHLGNDEVHIVWSEHHRDYRRGIIPTEFGDVLIVIYPIRHGLHRVQIMKKPEIPYFGPLFDGAVVNSRVLPVLVRETAINAGRAKRSLINLYQPFYEERTRYLQQIIDQFKDEQSFEDYCSHLFSPAPAHKTSPTSGHVSPIMNPDVPLGLPKISSSSSSEAFNSNNNSSSSGGNMSRLGSSKKSQAPLPPPARLGISLSSNYPGNDLHLFRHKLASAATSMHLSSESSSGSLLSGSNSGTLLSNSFDSSHASSSDTKSSRYSLFRKSYHVRAPAKNTSHPQFSIAEESFVNMSDFPTPPHSPPSEFPPSSDS